MSFFPPRGPDVELLGKQAHLGKGRRGQMQSAASQTPTPCIQVKKPFTEPCAQPLADQHWLLQHGAGDCQAC